MARFRDPARCFAHTHPAGADYVPLLERHVRLLKSQGSADLVLERLGPALNGAPLALSPPPEGLTLGARRARHVARVSGPRLRLMRAGREATCWVRVTNASAHPWPATSESGIYLSYEFVGLRDETPIMSRRVAAELKAAVAPGETIAVQVRLTCPARLGRKPHRLRFAMVDDGIGAFAEHGRGASEGLVIPWSLPLAVTRLTSWPFRLRRRRG